MDNQFLPLSAVRWQENPVQRSSDGRLLSAPRESHICRFTDIISVKYLSLINVADD